MLQNRSATVTDGAVFIGSYLTEQLLTGKYARSVVFTDFGAG
jgi:hypothetical protein